METATLNPIIISPLAAKALEVATSQIGVHEIPAGSNSGPQVNIYLKSVGLGGGYSWCQSFAFWCYLQASNSLGVDNPMPKTAGVIDHWNKSPKHHVTVPQVGDLFVLDFKNGSGHIGFVTSVDLVKGIYHTIEGNSNTNGSADGEEVANRQFPLYRPIAMARGFLRY